jgi:hypothetical protein
MKLVSIKRSPKEGKKWRATFDNNGRISHTDFGAAGMDDFTISKDPEQAKRYRTRHKKDLETGDPRRAGFLSYYVLWASPDFEKNVREYKKRFNL